MKRKTEGMPFERIAETVSVFISPNTVKRWWNRYTGRVDGISQWMARELILDGIDEDLLRCHSSGVNPSRSDTLRWFQTLLGKFSPQRGMAPSLRGFWSGLNVQLPTNLRI